MEPETVLNLCDSFWFYHKFFETQSITSISSNPETNTVPQIQEICSNPTVSRQLTIHKRSKSDQFVTPKSPNSVFLSPHLETIRSGKQLSIEIPKRRPLSNKPSKGFSRKVVKRQRSKSLSELEFEELTGFMDLGFVFSEEDKEDSDLVGIIPGLQRLGQEVLDGASDEPRARPYLSEVWERKEEEEEEEEEEENTVMKWRLPAAANEIDMKDSLKWWAHSVATAAAAAR